MSRGNEPAYPATLEHPSGGFMYPHPGMTKREAFAMAAMQGIITGRVTRGDIEGDYDEEGVAVGALAMADALLAALEE